MSMTKGEWLSIAVSDYAHVYGAEHPEREWILTPFDTWERNPYYTGKPGSHPDDPEELE